MSVKRSINTKIWSDKWIETLSPVEKLVWIYLLTNDYTNMLGIYQVTIKRIIFETGLSQTQIFNALKAFERVRKGFYWLDEWVVLPNWMKNQSMNANMLKSAIDAYNILPNCLIEKLLSNGFESFESLSKGYPILRNNEYEVEIESEVEIEEEKNPIPGNLFTLHYPLYETTWTLWKKYRKEKKKPIKPYSEELAFKELYNLSNGDPAEALKIVEHAIAGDYQGLFALNSNGKNKPEPKPDEPKVFTLKKP